MAEDWNSYELWRKQIERRLYELGALAKGAIPIQADRINDVVEQIQDLRKILEDVVEDINEIGEELKSVQLRMDKMSEWAKEHTKKENGGTT